MVAKVAVVAWRARRTSAPPSSQATGGPDEGWQLGRIRRRCRRAPFTHVVGYRTKTATFAGEGREVLDTATN